MSGPIVLNSLRTLARNPIASYALPGEGCLAYNKIEWDLNLDRVVLLVHDMQNYWVNWYVDRAPLLTNVVSLMKAFRDARAGIFLSR